MRIRACVVGSGACDSFATIANISTELSRTGVKFALTRNFGVPANGDDGTIHKHLAVANLIKPGPLKQRFTRTSVGGYCEPVIRFAGTAWAVANVGMNNGPRFTAVVGKRYI